MSLINDALKKAQKEKDNRYEHYENLISATDNQQAEKKRKRTFLIPLVSGIVVLIVSVAIASYMLFPNKVNTNLTQQVVEPKDDTATAQATTKRYKITKSLLYKHNAANSSKSNKPSSLAKNLNTPIKIAQLGDKSDAQERSLNKEDISATPHETFEKSNVQPKSHGSNEAQPRKTNEEQTQSSISKSKQIDTKNTGKKPERRHEIPDTQTLYQQALSYQRNNDLHNAEKMYRMILGMDPNQFTALNNLGVMCMCKKRNDDAVRLFKKAISIKKDYVDPYYNLACIYSRTGNISQSLNHLKKALELNSEVTKWVENDKDLLNLRRSAKYKNLISKRNKASEAKALDVYTVKKDEWIFDIIRKKYGVPNKDIPKVLKTIKSLNPALRDSNTINPGQKILLPKNG